MSMNSIQHQLKNDLGEKCRNFISFLSNHHHHRSAMKSSDKNRTIKPHSRMDEIHNQMAPLKESIKRKKEIIADHLISLSF